MRRKWLSILVAAAAAFSVVAAPAQGQVLAGGASGCCRDII